MAAFYCEQLEEEEFILSEEESIHCIKVLRHKKGDTIEVRNGNGLVKQALIISDNSKKTVCKTLSASEFSKEKTHRIHIAISPTKNMDRIEWFVEKACELDIDEISFIFADHSERKILKTERLHKKAVSAMKQSGGYFRSVINEPVKLKDFLTSKNHSNVAKYIAFVDHKNTNTLKKKCVKNSDCLILIGPEGDFSDKELELSKEHNFLPVALGKKVLRTETAGIIACHSVNFINDY